MSRRAALFLGALALPLGCRAIAGLTDLTYVAPAHEGCSPITLPTAGAGRIRIVNAGTAGDAADFCVRPSGAASWGQPLFRPASNAASCPSGLAYAQATVPLAVASGTVDVEAIAVGGSCDGAATSKLTGIAVENGATGAPVMTVVRMGGAGQGDPEAIVALAEDLGTNTNEGRVRIVNALSGTIAINIGDPAAPTLPTMVATPLLAQPIPPGAVPQPNAQGALPIDANGYLTTPASPVSFGAVAAGSTNALFVSQTAARNLSPLTGTIYAIGVPGSTPPVRGLYCEEDIPAEGDGGAGAIEAPCTLSALSTLAIDTWNVELKGAITDYEAERRPYVMQDIAARTSDDVMCLLEVSRQSDKELVAEAGAPRYPYTYAPVTDLDTPFDDPTLADGGVPPAPSGPPCAGVSSTDITKVFTCVAQNCSTTGDMTGTLRSTTDCLSAKCFLAAAPLYHTGPAQNACLDCIIYELSSFETVEASETTCTGDPHQPFAFQGQTPSMIVSRYPLLNTRDYQLPSTGWRRAILYAQVQLEDQTVDFYCAQLTDRNNGPSLAYAGSYGADETTDLPDGGVIFESGWELEQDVQVQKTIAFIRANSKATGRPAIIAGDWHASVFADAEDGGLITNALSPEVMAPLDGAFVRAEPPGFPGECTWCPAPQNPYNNGGMTNADFVVPYLSGFPSSSTTFDEVWGTDLFPIAGDQDEAPPAGGMGPPSFYFAKGVRIVRPPVSQ